MRVASAWVRVGAVTSKGRAPRTCHMTSGTQVQLDNEGKHPCGYFNGVGRNSDHLQQVNYPELSSQNLNIKQ